MELKVGLLSDSESYYTKEVLFKKLETNKKIKFVDLGVFRENETYDPQGLGDRAAQSISDGTCNCCLLISSSGNGLQMYANKNKHVRAVACLDTMTATVAINEFNANMCDMPQFMPIDKLVKIAETFLETFLQRGSIKNEME